MTASAFPPVVALLPHEPPMVLLDDVVAKDAQRVACRLTLRDDAPFVADGCVRGVVTLEYMAQAAGVYAGLEARARGEPIPWGFLIGCNELTLECDAIAVGTVLLVEAERTWGDARLGQFECQVRLGDGACIARATLSVAQADPAVLE